ncbi:DUF456 domain-containing protein [Pseudalkalibacillus hwajinpoensis]|uniref:DUF456 domain-containing protein n=1 Tax=Guptibacillus hwajinpoensis TaxID=208199 RepID=UPI001CD24D9A|nr:DUF456 domain-containing protein [Pseudalkalibacillus hwajinpoensis]MCA0992943.1 DUF456 domain-containing protein [Pseudalkalibacillus hwajinpoensis]
MDILIWSLIVASFIIAFVGLIYPIIPAVLFIYTGFILYGIFYDFGSMTLSFWIIQVMLTLLLFAADYASNLFGVKKYGGSKAAIWGSTIGLLVGPFIIPFAGIILGPFIGAVVAELAIHRKPFKESVQVGVGSLLGFLGGAVMKGVLQAIMITVFLVYVL